jgi:hypothetical protein
MILRGSKPTKIELAITLKTAQALGLSLSLPILAGRTK